MYKIIFIYIMYTISIHKDCGKNIAEKINFLHVLYYYLRKMTILSIVVTQSQKREQCSHWDI